MATYYVDPSVASGTASTNSASPGNSFANAVTAATGDQDIIKLAEGYVYAPATAASYSQRVYAKTPAVSLTIDSYTAASNPSPSSPPVISAAQWEPASGATGWTHVSSGIWAKPYTNTGTSRAVFRLFVGANLSGTPANNSLGTGYSIGTPKRCAPVAYNASEATILAALNATNIWAANNADNTGYGGASTGVLYVYTGSTTINPPTYYNGMMIVMAASLTNTGFEVRDSSRIIVKNIDVVGAGYTGIYVYSTNSINTDNEVSGCNVYAGGWRGYRVAGASTFPMSRVNIHDGLIKACAHPDEEWTTYAYSDWLFDLQEGISASSYSDSVYASNMEILDTTHASISAGGTSGGAFNCNNIHCSSPNRHYGRAFVVVGAGGPFNLNRVNVDNMTAWIEVLGYSTKTTVTASTFSQGSEIFPAYVGSNSTPGSAGLRAISVFSSAAATTLVADSLIMDNCVLSNPQGPVLQLEQFTGGSDIPANAVRFRNCVIEDANYLSTRMLTDTVDAAGISIIVKVLAGKTIPAIDVTNTAFIRPTAGANVLLESIGSNTPTPRVLTALSTDTACSELTEKAGALADDFTLVANSSLIGAGTHIQYRSDAAGKQFFNPPSIGAYEYARPHSAATSRTSSTARTLATGRAART